MTTRAIDIPKTQPRLERLVLCGATVLTYAVGLWIVSCNPYVLNTIQREPLTWTSQSDTVNVLLSLFVFIFGSTPVACLTHIAIVAAVVQCVNFMTTADDDLDIELSRPFVFWRALYRFTKSCLPFLRGKELDGPPKTSLTEYERITVRYLFVKLLFVPLMISFFYNTVQSVINTARFDWGSAHFTAFYIQHLYTLAFCVLMTVDIAWFALGCTVETQQFSPVRMVDPYASGWLITLCCYPPLVNLSGQYLVWGPPEFPAVFDPRAAVAFACIGLILYTFYVVADLSFGLKMGNLTYKGLVERGPYKLIRHPMYASKNLAWVIFSLPGFQFHIQKTAVAFAGLHVKLPFIAGNWGMIWPMAAWVSIYALRGLTEERYLLRFPEYREYCKRVRYRFIPGVI